MKKDHYYFDMTDETYKYILNKGILKESRKEKTILDLCRNGEPLKTIMNHTGYSMRTISYRKQDIYNKISKYIF